MKENSTLKKAETKQEKKNGGVFAVIGMVAGVLVGSQVLGSIILGLVLAIALGALGAYIDDRRG